MELLNSTVAEFTESLASKAPVPGGGGASALVGAVGIALGDMVGEFTVGKKRYADVEEEMKALMEKAQDLRVKLLACIEKDAAAFEPLSRAYAIPKDAPEREKVMEECLRAAAAPPFEILGLCGEAIDLLQAFAEKGSVIVLSDAACGAAFCRSAMQGAAVNILINTKSMRDRDYAGALDAKTEELLAQYLPLAEEIYNKVTERIG
ncbi:MAG: cyclodeaminase/cyclohydrolase family protein [Lachnospiraceae bacterium]|nr:cyclodeaminase/cyclohydrolase family protein [Lachnospiraceae bacterium]